MNFAVKISSSDTAPKSTYDVLIENQPDGTVKATLLGLPECQGIGNTETEAIEEVSQSLQSRLESAKIVTLAIEAAQSENPWLKFAGMHKDNPLFDEVIAYIEEERSELDIQMEASHANFINEFENEIKQLGLTEFAEFDDFLKLVHFKHYNQYMQPKDAESNL
ncbi:hypothetical protein [Amazonocrinis nigriterrae]|uniref:hypothetical protein n=1 Tax=Amazonocrinis nigriterrae TaxID=2840443 RepID=UPI001CEC0DCF|nr:hypothetical protein [Amazonocrinis nigriterrae]